MCKNKNCKCNHFIKHSRQKNCHFIIIIIIIIIIIVITIFNIIIITTIKFIKLYSLYKKGSLKVQQGSK